MSTFAVFGMTRDVALAEAKKRTKGTRKNVEVPGGVEPIPLAEWMELVEKKTEQIMGGGTVRQLSPLFDAPQYAEQFIELARKTIQCRDLRIRAKRVMTGADGKPIINPKTKAQRVGFCEWHPAQRTQAA
ncbi:hypothetical protein [Pseudomonas lundensis]|uniref:hypothetical protein n=1 Tax=Pseudomonas lundensis TaxID=86185 RepID=UPI00193BA3C9|nr:hypothetical protein [Pseudomonas lundensis]MBM1183461.1 hypothetical protein [Pseudomonas lundensis]